MMTVNVTFHPKPLPHPYHTPKKSKTLLASGSVKPRLSASVPDSQVPTPSSIQEIFGTQPGQFFSPDSSVDLVSTAGFGALHTESRANEPRLHQILTL